MEYLEYLSSHFLDEVMRFPDNLKAKYKEALALIVDQGMRPERAFTESGFIEAYTKHKEAPATTPASTEAGAKEQP
jgi:hypothetical protein